MTKTTADEEYANDEWKALGTLRLEGFYAVTGETDYDDAEDAIEQVAAYYGVTLTDGFYRNALAEWEAGYAQGQREQAEQAQ